MLVFAVFAFAEVGALDAQLEALAVLLAALGATAGAALEVDLDFYGLLPGTGGKGPTLHSEAAPPLLDLEVDLLDVLVEDEGLGGVHLSTELPGQGFVRLVVDAVPALAPGAAQLPVFVTNAVLVNAAGLVAVAAEGFQLFVALEALAFALRPVLEELGVVLGLLQGPASAGLLDFGAALDLDRFSGGRLLTPHPGVHWLLLSAGVGVALPLGDDGRQLRAEELLLREVLLEDEVVEGLVRVVVAAVDLAVLGLLVLLAHITRLLAQLLAHHLAGLVGARPLAVAGGAGRELLVLGGNLDGQTPDVRAPRKGLRV